MSSDATTALLEEHGTRMWNVCLRLGRHYSIESADLFQDVWIRVVRTLPTKPADAPDAAWLVGVAKNVALELSRAENRHRRREARYAALSGLEAAHAPSATPLSHWVTERITSGLAGLSPQRRGVVQLRWVAGLTTGETAAEMGIAPGTVKATLHGARRELTDRLDSLRDLWRRGDL